MLNSCRVCFNNNINELNMFACNLTCNGMDITIQQAFEECTQIETEANDRLCHTCVETLKDYFSFLITAKASDAQLKLISIAHDDMNAGSEVAIKDPLEDPLNDELPHTSNYDTKINQDSSDTDEDKPLIKFVKSDSVIQTDKAANLTIITDNEESDDFSENDNNFTQSIEEQIFPTGSFVCKICDKTYFTASGLNAHQDIHLPKSAIAKKRRLRRTNQNQRGQKAEEKLSVKAAENVSDAKDDDTKTVEATTSNIRKARPTKLFPCQYCGKQMISASKLRYHMVMHTGEKNFLCTMCPKAYSTIYALKHHMRTHTGERPYECKFCGDRFLRPTTLKSHMRRHTGERPYGCEICGKRFIQHSSMATHMKLNHMDKTIACPHCDKKYARKTDLNTHLLSHTGDKPFACQLCNSRFIRQANLNKHMNQHHAGLKAADESAKQKLPQKSNVVEEQLHDNTYARQGNLVKSNSNDLLMHIKNEETKCDAPKTAQL